MSALRSKLNPEFKSQNFDADAMEYKADFSTSKEESDSSKETKKVADLSRFDSD